MKKSLALMSLCLMVVFGVLFFTLNKSNTKLEGNPQVMDEPKEETIPVVQDDIKSILVTAVGDCTIGWDDRYAYKGRYDYYLKENNNDYSYYFAKVRYLFENDDLTIANLEGTFTDYDKKVEKKFNFKAPKEYVQVLTTSSIDAVSLGNNHTYDYGETGFKDTKNTLDENNIPYYVNEEYLIKDVKGIKVGFFSFLDIYGQKKTEVKKAIDYLKEQGVDLIIASMHWGIEYDYDQSKEQVNMGHYLIDNGVDLVIGHHPHIIQGIEKYKDKYILYSLGNFSFGGNSLPRDMDTYIWQQTFTFENGKLRLDDNINIIPAYVSSVTKPNNYQPVVLEGDRAKEVMKKIMKYSSGFEYNTEN